MTSTPYEFWAGKCVIITGASSGIGWALAEQLSSCGAKIGLLARREGHLERLQLQIESAGGAAAWATADVAVFEQTRSATCSVENALGPCDVLVANAGIYHQSHGKRFDAISANRVVATNVQGVINAFGAVLPGMLERRQGRLVAVSSIAGLLGLPAAGAYSGSKAAVVTLMRSLGVDLRGTGVGVTTICPGFVDTPMITDRERGSLKSLLTAEQVARRIGRAIERGKVEDWFPWRTWFAAWLASLLPVRVYQRLISLWPEMEEADPALQSADSVAVETGDVCGADSNSACQPEPHDAKQNQRDAS